MNPILCLVALFFTSIANAEDSKSLWEYGFGIGHLRFEQYPASDQYSSLALPFPTFQYRGEILRADDREGARAYLLKEDRYSLEFTGGGTPPLNSDNNQARRGMKNIPLILLLGPQLVFKLLRGLELKFSALQATSTNFYMTQFTGQVYESKLDYRWDLGSGHSGRVIFSLSSASREFLSNFYEVGAHETDFKRPYYETKGGFYATEITYFQAYATGRISYYLGATLNDYSHTANRASPLFRRNQTLNYLVGFTYVLGESERRSVPADKGDGLFEKLYRRANSAL